MSTWPNTATKAQLRMAHKAKMRRKKAERAGPQTGSPHSAIEQLRAGRTIRANLSRRHPDGHLTLREHLAAKAKRASGQRMRFFQPGEAGRSYVG